MRQAFASGFRKGRVTLVLMGLVWFGVAATATLWMLAYSNTPGKALMPPSRWPGSSQISRDDRPTLLMFIHPHCPCSRASIGELALLMAQCQNRVNAQILFLRPAQMDADWTLTDTYRAAAQIPGVTVHRDDDGREARLFHAETSGDSVLYDAKGDLMFHGGITISRGHSGDNPGRDAIQSLLMGTPAQQTNTPTFGCTLFDCKQSPP